VRSAEKLGFKLEGVHIKGLDGRQDAISYGMLRRKCRWLKENRNGQKLTNAADAA
jgi:RimJ/RimL family protein N-acetyltransferase